MDFDEEAVKLTVMYLMSQEEAILVLKGHELVVAEGTESSWPKIAAEGTESSWPKIAAEETESS